MRVVSLVPSWTETFIAAGVDVVGRTRYCLHPEEQVKSIPIVGGTKSADWDKIRELNPDIVIMDREENTKEMADECPVLWFSTHVRSMQDMPAELKSLASTLKCPPLLDFAHRWETIVLSPGPKRDSNNPPALVSWETPLQKNNGPVIYTIWANPWMAAGRNTFIGSVLAWCGWDVWGNEKYPRFEPEAFKDQSPIFLCSTEPFPFAKRKDLLATLPGSVAIVDGEKVSWFGLRSLVYLESIL